MNTSPIAHAVTIPNPGDAHADPTPQHRAILQRLIDDGARRAAALLATLEREQPRDQILRTPPPPASTYGPARPCASPSAPTSTSPPTSLGQIAARAGIPLPYLRELIAPAASAWQRDLGVEILRRHHGHTDGRVLVRSVAGQLRGWLSPSTRWPPRRAYPSSSSFPRSSSPSPASCSSAIAAAERGGRQVPDGMDETVSANVLAGFRRRDSNPNKRNQNPLSCH